MPAPEQIAPIARYPTEAALAAEAAPDAKVLDLRWIMAFVWRRAWIMSLVFALALIGVAAVYLMQDKVFTASSTILLDRSKFNVVSSLKQTTDEVLDSAAVDTEVQVLSSRELADRVVTTLHLENNPEFNPTLPGAPKPNPLQRLYNKLMAKLNGRTPPSGPPTADAIHTMVINNVLAGEQIKRVNLTYAIRISFQADTPQTAALLANTIAQQYVASELDAEVAATQDASQLVEQRLGDLRGQVLGAEDQAQQYRSSHNLLGTGVSDQTLTQQEISNLNLQLAQAKTNQAEAEARLNTAKQQLASGSNGDDVGQALSSSVVSELRGQRATVSRQVADLSANHGPDWPALKTAKSQLADIDSAIQAEIRRIISSLEADANVARDRTATIQRSRDEAQGALVKSNQAQVRLNDLDRNTDSVSSLYQSFLDRYKETTVQQGTERAKAKLIGVAIAPKTPSSPKAILFLAAGGLAALILALAAGLLMEAIENGLATSRDIERLLGIRALSSIPELGSTLTRAERRQVKRDPARYVVLKPLSGFAESLRSLRTSLSFSRQDRNVQLVVVTSALPGEGKTTSAVALGRSYALAGASVIIVDADVRRPSLARVANVKAGPGLMEVLRGEMKLDAVVVKDAVTDAHILQAGSQANGDLILDSAMDRLIDQLRQQYSVVVVDTAPVLPVAETRVLASKADAVLFLTRWRRTPAQAASAALAQLQSVDAPVAGVALTNVDVRKQARFGYGDPAFYYDAYKKYYAT